MKNIKLLDCTLRDGGRIIDCNFSNDQIKGVTEGLCNANIDIIELGFLRGNCVYNQDSTIFTEIEQLKKFIPEDKKNSLFVAFSDYGKEYGMWDFKKIVPYDEKSIDGFRVGYRKKDFKKALETFNIVKDNGYKLFVQGVESLNYTDLEILKVIEVINKIKPYSFGIVDTYGAMYKDDVLRLFNLIDNNLEDGIAIDFHSHNNMQLSFSFAQEVIEKVHGDREVVIDCTLAGLGKGAGNLNTELVVDYLNRKKFYNYDQDVIMDVIDEYISWIQTEKPWGYSIPNFIAGIYSSHANNLIYLMDKHKLRTKDIKTILSMLSPDARKRYNYDLLEEKYNEYMDKNFEDADMLNKLKRVLSKKKLLVIVPGHTLVSEKEVIDDYIEKEDCNIISVNFVDQRSDFVFFASQTKYDKFKDKLDGKKVIITSNIDAAGYDYKVNYSSIVEFGLKCYDNPTIMLLNLLLKIGETTFAIAGFDGFSDDKNNYYSADYSKNTSAKNYKTTNENITKYLKGLKKKIGTNGEISFLTPGLFTNIFNK